MGILLTIAYDGTHYCGWQRQENAMTVQQCLELALSKALKKPITVIGASRTDTGVHALGQRALLRTDSVIPLEKIPYAVNTFLPEDIRVIKAVGVEAEFHPQYEALNKTYRYHIQPGPFLNPLMRQFSWHVYQDLDFDLICQGAEHFIGTYDFSAFCATGGSAKTTVRTIYSLDVKRDKEQLYFDINGNGFLYNMVRIIAGTLVYCGMGRISPGDIPGIINSRDRTKAGITAPPQGLCLMEINYSMDK